MMSIETAISQTVGLVLLGKRRVTKYLSPTLVVKATAFHKDRKGARSRTIAVTIGKPNYAERAFISVCDKAGEPFPVAKCQTKDWK